MILIISLNDMPLIRSYVVQDNIQIFDSHLDPSRSSYDSYHLKECADAEASHFWFKTRRDKICRLFQQKINKSSRILEIGGGTGFIAQHLKKLGFSIELSDIYLNGLKYAQEKGIEKLYQFDLFNPPFHEEFDLICLFDVLEHQKNDKEAFECIKKMLKPRGTLLLTVPAHQWLWNRDDRINGHYRRYTKKSLIELSRQCGLQPTRIEYFFIFILPLLFARTLINPNKTTTPAENEKLKIKKLPLGFDALCYGLTKLEFSLARWLPNIGGGSLLMIAEK